MLARTAALLVVLSLAPAAHAQSPWFDVGGYGGGFGGYGTWANGWGGLYNTGGFGYVPPPPYYAVHPPVYYSHQIVRRPYGTSPYALPAIHQIGLAPKEIIAEAPVAAAPQIIVNPFVAGAENFVPPSTAEEIRQSQPAVIPASPMREPSPTLPAPMPQQ